MRELSLLLDWLFEEALPLWSEVGVDRKNGGFIERLTPDGTPTDDPRRARVVARQIFSFAKAEKLGWRTEFSRNLVRHGIDALERHHFSSEDRMVVPLVSFDGRVLSHDFDLYDHAFVLFALAAAHEIGEQKERLEAVALNLLARIRKGWGHPVFGFEESQPRSLPLKANPHMHMLEACLAWNETGTSPEWGQLADEIVGLCLNHFITKDGALREFYDGDWNPLESYAESVVEPGHQFEWAWLLLRWGGLRNRSDAILVAHRLIFLAEAHGVDAIRGLAVNELNSDLTVRDSRARLWPQTERLKAQVALAGLETDEGTKVRALQIAAQAGRGLLTYFRHPVKGAWWEHLDREGKPIIEHSRASSLYHIVCAIDALNESQTYKSRN